MWIGSLGPRKFWGTRATNFSIYTTKMGGAGPKILGTGAKFKQVPCQKNCRVNRANMSLHLATVHIARPGSAISNFFRIRHVTTGVKFCIYSEMNGYLYIVLGYI